MFQLTVHSCNEAFFANSLLGTYCTEIHGTISSATSVHTCLICYMWTSNKNVLHWLKAHLILECEIIHEKVIWSDRDLCNLFVGQLVLVKKMCLLRAKMSWLLLVISVHWNNVSVVCQCFCPCACLFDCPVKSQPVCLCWCGGEYA